MIKAALFTFTGLIALVVISALQQSHREAQVKQVRSKFEEKLDELNNPSEKQKVLSRVYSLCGDFRYAEQFGSIGEARNLAKNVNEGEIYETGVRAICPRYFY